MDGCGAGGREFGEVYGRLEGMIRVTGRIVERLLFRGSARD
jgi:hypothetical protein